MKKTAGEKLKREFMRILGQILPKNRSGDRIWSWVYFVLEHQRLPSKKRAGEDFFDFLYDLKLGDEILSPLRLQTSDKALVKEYVKIVAGDIYNVKTIAILKTEQEIDDFDFPDCCVIKPSHGSGEVILRRHGVPIDKVKIKAWLKKNKYLKTREAQYKNLEPKIIVEEFVFGEDIPADYKIFCKGGKVRFVQLIADRGDNVSAILMSDKWVSLETSKTFPMMEEVPPKPKNFPEMIELALQLSRELDFARVDLYSNGKEIKVGEITHLPGNLVGKFIPQENTHIINQIFFEN